MPRTRVQRIQDSVHGLMEFRGMENIVVDVLRTPETQRLRRIKQLGLAHFVFPGAEHSRLVHCLGAAYVAILFARHLAEACRGQFVAPLLPGPAAARDLAVAALCHDLGHGPLSHAWEREIVGENYDFDKWASALGLASERADLKSLKWHELVGQALLAYEEGQLHQLLESHEAGFSKRIMLFLRGSYYVPYLPRLLSSDVDVDRADFLKRDTHLSGVAYGRYDLEWLISTSTVGSASGKLVLGFDQRKSLRVIEQFLIARRALYETLYYHKTVRSAEGMVALFLRRLREAVKEKGEPSVSSLAQPLIKVIGGDTLTPRELLSLDDFSLWVLIDNIASAQKADETAQDLAKRILARDLFKAVPCHPSKVDEFLRNDHAREKIYDVIQPFCPGKREYYLVVDTMRFSMFSGDETHFAYFIDGDRTGTPIRDHEHLLPYRQSKISSVRLFTIREAVTAVQNLIDSH